MKNMGLWIRTHMEWLYRFEVSFFMPMHVWRFLVIRRLLVKVPIMEKVKSRLTKIRSFVLRQYLYRKKSIYIGLLRAMMIKERISGKLQKRLSIFKKSVKKKSTFNEKILKTKKKKGSVKAKELTAIVNAGLKDVIKNALELNNFIQSSGVESREIEAWEYVEILKSQSYVKVRKSQNPRFRFPMKSFLEVQGLFLKKINLAMMGLIMKSGPYPLLQEHSEGTTTLLERNGETGTILMKDLLSILNYAKSTANILKKQQKTRMKSMRRRNKERKRTEMLKNQRKTGKQTQSGQMAKREEKGDEMKGETADELFKKENELKVPGKPRRRDMKNSTAILNEMNARLGLIPDGERFNYLGEKSPKRKRTTKLSGFFRMSEERRNQNFEENSQNTANSVKVFPPINRVYF